MRRSPEHFKQQSRALLQQGRIAAACDLLVELCRSNPRDVEAWMLLGAAQGQQGCLEETVRCSERALELQPEYADARFNLAQACFQLGRRQEARAHFQGVLRRQPENLGAWLNLGILQQESGSLAEAVQSFRRVLELQPANAEAWNNLANTLVLAGDVETAWEMYRHALHLAPRYRTALSNYLLSLNYRDLPPADVFAEHRRAGAIMPAVTPDFTNPPDPDRRLRVGYLSPDLYAHSVAWFISPLFAAHDRAGFEIFAYADLAKPDAITERLRGQADAWRSVRGLDDTRAAELIRADGIDILVDLGGHTRGSRLFVLAQRPAPVQVSYLGYPNTTGLDAVQFRLTDACADPPGGVDGYATEELIRLDGGFLCYSPRPDAPDAMPPPCAFNGHVTFGSFNALQKVSPGVVECWSALLRRVRGSRLLLKNAAFRDAAVQQQWLDRFAGCGIGPERLDLRGWLPTGADHLSLYGEVDVALDTFPYNGTATTCEALWMGVPVVTLAGQVHAARVGASLLHRVGLDHLVAADTREYLDKAVALAADAAVLGEMRGSLRQRMAASPLCDAARLAHSIEESYRSVWRRWCVTA